MTDTSTLSKLPLAPGMQLTLRDWPLAEPSAARAQVLIVHGLGEHSGRYEHVAQKLHSWGYSVRSFDLWGHGLSDGERGSMRDEHAMLDDLTTDVANGLSQKYKSWLTNLIEPEVEALPSKKAKKKAKPKAKPKAGMADSA
jgi:alpha-beta hydrolase superfamily lysophospholipase